MPLATQEARISSERTLDMHFLVRGRFQVAIVRRCLLAVSMVCLALAGGGGCNRPSSEPQDTETPRKKGDGKATVRDGLDDEKRKLLRLLGDEHATWSKALLRDVFRGKIGKESDRTRASDQEPGLRARAALFLALEGDDSIKPDVNRLLPRTKVKADVAALEVCLALLGDPSYLKPDHFRLESFCIGLAALKAIERYKGAHGMEALVKGGIHHPWGRVNDEALLTFERITGKKMSPGEIEDWWEVEHEGQRDRPRPVLKLEGNTDQLRCVAVSPDGKLIASGSNDSSAKVWDAHTGKLLHTLRGHGFTVTHVAFHPSGKQLASGSGDLTIKVWDLNTGTGIFTLQGHRHWILQVAYSPDGKRLASASEDCTVRVWDARSAAVLLTLRGHRAAVSAVSFSPNGRQLATAGRDGTVRLWDAATGKEIRTLEAHAGWGESVAYSPDGKWLATTGVDENTIKLWDVASGKLLRTLKGHTSSVSGAVFSPDGTRVASAGWDKLVKVWDAATGKELVSFKGHPEMINGLAYTPDGKRLATASEDKTIRIWELAKIPDAVPATERK